MQQQNPKRQKIRLELPGNLTPTYANAAMVSQTHSEIIMDFIQIMPNDPRARIQSRVPMTPANAKLFLKALQQNIERYENKHGEITLPDKPLSLADQLFQSINSDDEENGEADDDEKGGS